MSNAPSFWSLAAGLTGLLCAGLPVPLQAQIFFEADMPVAECTDSNCQTTYESEFFTPYAPVTALDMVNNLPGFNLDNGDSSSRGFGGAAGNILINGERVSAKSETPSDLLSRIPAADVERIIVLRGQVGGTDLRGQSVIADVIRRDGGATGAWSVTTAMAHPDTRLLPSGSVSYSDRSGPLGYTLGAGASRSRFLLDAEEIVLDGDGQQTEIRDEVYAETDERFDLSANATYEGARTRYGLNAQYEYEDEVSGEDSLRQAIDQDAFLLVQDNDSEDRALELGIDAERRLGQHLSAKLIGLYRRDDQSSQRRLILGEPNQAGETTTETRTDQLETERILRLELDYSGIRGQLIEASVEGAINRLDSDFELLRLGPAGLEPVDVPGARTDVEEERLDFAIANSFSLGEVSVDLELAGEASEIKQTGGFQEERTFFFWKPNLTLSHAPRDDTLWRARLLRRVNQLNFSDFVSAADLGDDELQLGNPSLSPETTVTLDLSYEKRFNDIGLISLTAFYDRIDDVEDILPLEGGLEVPGNIGSGFRWGLRGEFTAPLERIGISGGRLDFTGRWQRSGVDDPLSGQQRELSNERPWTARIDFRQDLPAAGFAWGMDAGFFGPYENFGLDELDRFSRVWDFGGFVETRAIENLRIRLGVSDLFRETTDRDRLVFDGPRNSAPLDFREIRDRTRSRRIFLQVRGVF